MIPRGMPTNAHMPQSRHKADYTKLFNILKKRRITLGSFVRQAGISKCDHYLIRLGEIMSIEGEYQACVFLHCDTSDIRDLVLRYPEKEEPKEPEEPPVEYHSYI